MLGFTFGFVDVGGTLLIRSLSGVVCGSLCHHVDGLEFVDSMDFRDDGVEDAAVVLRGCVVACSARLF